MKESVLVFLVLLISLPVATSQDIALSVEAHPRVLRVGDRVAFTITYINSSTKKLGIISEGHVYEAADIDLTKASTRQRGILLPYLTLEYDFAGVARALRILKPGQMYQRRISAKVSLTFPRGVKSNDTQEGLYLLFSSSAIKLPGFGTYRVSAEYAVTDYLRYFLNAEDKRRLWIGKANAPPIEIEFRR